MKLRWRLTLSSLGNAAFTKPDAFTGASMNLVLLRGLQLHIDDSADVCCLKISVLKHLHSKQPRGPHRGAQVNGRLASYSRLPCVRMQITCRFVSLFSLSSCAGPSTPDTVMLPVPDLTCKRTSKSQLAAAVCDPRCYSDASDASRKGVALGSPTTAPRACHNLRWCISNWWMHATAP